MATQLSLFLLLTNFAVFKQAFGCSVANVGTYISDVTLIKSTSSKVLVESSEGHCYVWKVGTSSEEYVSCNDYSADEFTDWSSGDNDESNTRITDLTYNKNMSQFYTSIEMSRNGQDISIDLKSAISFNISQSDWPYWAYFTLSQENTTFLMFAASDDWQSNDSLVLAIEFQSLHSNTNFDIFVMELTGDFRAQMIWQLDNNERYDYLFVFSEMNMIQMPVEYTSCDYWMWYNYNYDKNNGILNLDYIDSNDKMDDRNYVSYEWFYSSTIKVTYYQLNENGTLTYTRESYEMELADPIWDDLTWLWITIGVVCGLIIVCIAYYFYRKKHKNNPTNDGYRPETGLAAKDGDAATDTNV